MSRAPRGSTPPDHRDPEATAGLRHRLLTNWHREAPYPEVDVSREADEGDFRDVAVERVAAFKAKYGRWPNFVGVTLGQVERLEAAYNLTGTGAVTHMTGIARGSIPLRFTGP